MMHFRYVTLVVAMSLLASSSATKGQSPTTAPDDWVALGTRIHGGFGSYIALGIRIGLDSLEQLGVKRGEVEVTFADGPKTPCPCIVDGVMLATGATAGRGNLYLEADKTGPDQAAVIVVRDPAKGRALRYVVPDSLRDRLTAWNKNLDPNGRMDALLKAPGGELFRREPVQ